MISGPVPSRSICPKASAMLRIYSPRRGAETRRRHGPSLQACGETFLGAHVEGTLAPVSRPTAPTSLRSSSTAARGSRRSTKSRSCRACGSRVWQTPVRRLDLQRVKSQVSFEEKRSACFTDAAQRHDIRLGQRFANVPESIGANVPRGYERSARPDSPLRRRVRVPRPWPNESSRCEN